MILADSVRTGGGGGGGRGGVGRVVSTDGLRIIDIR